MPPAAAIGGAALLGGVMGMSASQNAANAQSQAADSANQAQMMMFNQREADQKPWLQAGQQELGQLQDQMPDLTRKMTMADFQQDPGYQFTLNQGLQAMQRSAAAKGFLDSTGTMQNLNDYAQNMAANQYNNAYQRFTGNQQQRYNMMAGIANTGQVSAQNLGNMGMNAATTMGNNLMSSGAAQSAGIMGQANAMGNMLNTGANAYMQQNIMDRMFPQGGGGGVGGGGSGVGNGNNIWAGGDASRAGNFASLIG